MITKAIAEEFFELLRYKNCVFFFINLDYTTYTAGSEKYLSEQQKLFNKREISFICCLFNSNNGDIKKHSLQLIIDGALTNVYTAEQITAALALLSSTDKITILQYFINFLLPENIKTAEFIINNAAGTENKPETGFIIHDYTSICKNTVLLENNKVFCGPPAPDSIKCKNCSNGADREKNYTLFNNFFTENNVTLFAPSENARKVFSKAYPHLYSKIAIIPLQNIIKSGTIHKTSQKSGKLKIAFIGHPSYFKGWKEFIELASSFESERYGFFHLCNKKSEDADNVIFIETSYKNKDTETVNRLKEHDIDIVVMWSNFQGNYSYVYYECLAAGCFVITYKDSGNIKDEVLKYGNGTVLSSVKELHDLFADAALLKKLVSEYNTKRISFSLTANTRFADEIAAKSMHKNTPFSRLKLKFKAFCTFSKNIFKIKK